MTKQEILDEAKKRLAALDEERAGLVAMIAAAEGRAPAPTLVPMPVIEPWPAPYPYPRVVLHIDPIATPFWTITSPLQPFLATSTITIVNGGPTNTTGAINIPFDRALFDATHTMPSAATHALAFS